MRVLIPTVLLLAAPLIGQQSRDADRASGGPIDRTVSSIRRIFGGYLGPFGDLGPRRPRYAGMVPIPAGTFEMGRHVGLGDPDELPVHTVSVDAFYAGVCEVTFAEYAAYLNTAYAEGRVWYSYGDVRQLGGAAKLLCEVAESDPDSKITWNGTSFQVTAGQEDHPMLLVTWYGGCAYANQRSREDGLTPCYDEADWSCDFGANGYRLPTEAEWEYAARGGQHNPYTRYPWGDAIDGSMANYHASGDPWESTGPYPPTTPVGYYDGQQSPPGVDMANGYGLYDTAGNVWEWCWDYYDAGYYSSSPSDNPTGPVTGYYRVHRGGSWYSLPATLRSSNRLDAAPTYRQNYVGFRLFAARR